MLEVTGSKGDLSVPPVKLPGILPQASAAFGLTMVIWLSHNVTDCAVQCRCRLTRLAVHILIAVY